MKKIINTCLCFIAKLWSFFYSYSSQKRLKERQNKLYTAWLSREFNSIRKSSFIEYPIDLVGGQYISIGDKSSIGKRTILTAWDKHGSEKFLPQITIGDNVLIGEDSHITAINSIQIANNVLFGKKVTITDNAHGKSMIELLSLPPIDRPLSSDGPVIIEDGVWICDKVTILPNVRIGRNAIIGANAVVTKDIPANCVAGGIPAKVIKIIKE